MRSKWIIIVLIVSSFGCSEDHPTPQQTITSAESKRFELINDSLRNLHYKLNAPKKGEWLSAHPEKGENFEQYVQKWPKTANEDRTKLYLVKLSEFDSAQQVIFNLTSEYLGTFYDTKVDTISMSIDYNAIPEKFYRKNDLEEIQVLTDFFLKQKLLKALPEDAWGMIGCTAVDIYPDPQWNFVFGQASLSNRVGVWSMRRLGDPQTYPEIEDRSYMRNLKVASHETGHILSMKHCVYYDCLMNGSAHILENDSKPPYLCPVCLGKVDWNRNLNIKDRFDDLYEFWSVNEFDIYHQYYEIVREIDLD